MKVNQVKQQKVKLSKAAPTVVSAASLEMQDMLDIIKRFSLLRLPCKRYVMGKLNEMLKGPIVENKC